MRRGIAVIAVSLIPAAETLLLVALVLGGPLTRCIPWWTDEVHYWNEINSFRIAGFNCGYHVADESPARAAFSHFGPHGPLFPAMLGTLARITGWGQAAVPIFNLFFISLGIAGYLLLARPDWRAMITTAAALATLWPVLLYVPVTMQECLQQGLACLLAGLLLIRMRGPGKPDRPSAYGAKSILVLESLLRPTWSLVWVATALAIKPSLAKVAVAIIAAALFFAAFSWMSSPYPGFFPYVVAQSYQSPLAALSMLAENAGKNLKRLIAPDGNALELLLFWQFIGLTVWFSASLLSQLRQSCDRDSVAWRSSVFHAVNLGGALLLAIVLYELSEWRAYRVLAGPLLLSILLAIGLGRLRLVAIIITSNLIFVVSFLHVYEASHYAQFHRDPERITRSARVLRSKLRFDPNLSPWCNTLLWIAPEPWPPEVLGVPAGIGVTIISDPRILDKPFRSRYVLVNNFISFKPPVLKRLTPLAQLSFATVYENADANCEPSNFSH